MLQILFESELIQCVFTFSAGNSFTFCGLRETMELIFREKFFKGIIRCIGFSLIKLRIVYEVMSIRFSRFILLRDVLFIIKVQFLILRSVLIYNFNCESVIVFSSELS
jgi:hypothetical protein